MVDLAVVASIGVDRLVFKRRRVDRAPPDRPVFRLHEVSRDRYLAL